MAGCASAVPVEPAPAATDVACARLLVALRGVDDVGPMARRDTTGQSTAAWGEPPLTLRCGIDPLPPTTERCVEVAGVDWVVGEDDGTGAAGGQGDGPAIVLTTYGRAPAVQVRLPAAAPTGSDTVMQALGPAVAELPQRRRCL